MAAGLTTATPGNGGNVDHASGESATGDPCPNNPRPSSDSSPSSPSASISTSAPPKGEGRGAAARFSSEGRKATTVSLLCFITPPRFDSRPLPDWVCALFKPWRPPPQFESSGNSNRGDGLISARGRPAPFRRPPRVVERSTFSTVAFGRATSNPPPDTLSVPTRGWRTFPRTTRQKTARVLPSTGSSSRTFAAGSSTSLRPTSCTSRRSFSRASARRTCGALALFSFGSRHFTPAMFRWMLSTVACVNPSGPRIPRSITQTFVACCPTCATNAASNGTVRPSSGCTTRCLRTASSANSCARSDASSSLVVTVTSKRNALGRRADW